MGLLASFAAACNKPPFTLCARFSKVEASSYTDGYPEVSMAEEWKEALREGDAW